MSPALLLWPATLAYTVAHIPVHYTGTERVHPWWTHSPSYWAFVLLFDFVCIVAPLLGVVTVVAVSWIAEKLGVGRSKRADEDAQRARREQEKRAKLRMRLLAELETLSCGDEPPPLSVGDLPSGKRTVHLRLDDFKVKVCKPFAR